MRRSEDAGEDYFFDLPGDGHGHGYGQQAEEEGDPGGGGEEQGRDWQDNLVVGVKPSEGEIAEDEGENPEEQTAIYVGEQPCLEAEGFIGQHCGEAP